jgi:hypothetical protein
MDTQRGTDKTYMVSKSTKHPTPHIGNLCKGRIRALTHTHVNISWNKKGWAWMVLFEHYVTIQMLGQSHICEAWGIYVTMQVRPKPYMWNATIQMIYAGNMIYTWEITIPKIYISNITIQMLYIWNMVNIYVLLFKYIYICATIQMPCER